MRTFALVSGLRVGSLLLGELHLLPQPQHLVGICRLRFAEHVGMAANHLGIDVGAHVVDRELARIGGNLALEHHLQQHVAELLAQVSHASLLDGIDGLVRFFDHVVGDGGMRLGTVPWASAGCAQGRNGVDEIVEAGMARRGRAFGGWGAFGPTSGIVFCKPRIGRSDVGVICALRVERGGGIVIRTLRVAHEIPFSLGSRQVYPHSIARLCHRARLHQKHAKRTRRLQASGTPHAAARVNGSYFLEL